MSRPIHYRLQISTNVRFSHKPQIWNYCAFSPFSSFCYLFVEGAHGACRWKCRTGHSLSFEEGPNCQAFSEYRQPMWNLAQHLLQSPKTIVIVQLVWGFFQTLRSRREVANMLEIEMPRRSELRIISTGVFIVLARPSTQMDRSQHSM